MIMKIINEAAIKYLVPKVAVKNIYEIDYEQLKKEGICNLMFDVDNTIIERHSQQPEWKLKKFFRELKENKFNVLLISNNSRIKRMIKIASFLEVSINYFSFKPLPWIYRKMREDFNCHPSNTVYIGDQLFTDIFGAKLSGYPAIYTFPLRPESSLMRRTMIKVEKLIITGYLLKLGGACAT